MVRYHIIFMGQVQSRGFRDFTWKMSKKVGNLTGWVKNRNDGSVEAEIQGEEENINRFLDLVRKGRNDIRVDKIQMDKIDVIEGEKVYRVTH